MYKWLIVTGQIHTSVHNPKEYLSAKKGREQQQSLLGYSCIIKDKEVSWVFVPFSNFPCHNCLMAQWVTASKLCVSRQMQISPKLKRMPPINVRVNLVLYAFYSPTLYWDCCLSACMRVSSLPSEKQSCVKMAFLQLEILQIYVTQRSAHPKIRINQAILTMALPTEAGWESFPACGGLCSVICTGSSLLYAPSQDRSSGGCCSPHTVWAVGTRVRYLCRGAMQCKAVGTTARLHRVHLEGYKAA